MSTMLSIPLPQLGADYVRSGVLHGVNCNLRRNTHHGEKPARTLVKDHRGHDNEASILPGRAHRKRRFLDSRHGLHHHRIGATGLQGFHLN